MKTHYFAKVADGWEPRVSAFGADVVIVDAIGYEPERIARMLAETRIRTGVTSKRLYVTSQEIGKGRVI